MHKRRKSSSKPSEAVLWDLEMPAKGRLEGLGRKRHLSLFDGLLQGFHTFDLMRNRAFSVYAVLGCWTASFLLIRRLVCMNMYELYTSAQIFGSFCLPRTHMIHFPDATRTSDHGSAHF